MGNALRSLYGQCCSDQPPTTTTKGGGVGGQAFGHNGVSSSTAVGVSGLEQHLHHSQVTEGLSKHVGSSEKAQSKCFRRTAAGEAPPLADVLKFKLHTLPVDPRAVAAGDIVTVYVSTSCGRESKLVPEQVQMATVARNEARAQGKHTEANALHQQIKNAGYGVLHISNYREILARKYRIRLRGIDAPKLGMPYAKEAKDELVKIVDGKRLKILVFYQDSHKRWVGDVYCDGIFVQEAMLKRGLAWHYKAYDKRPELDTWEKDARARGIGLWASSNPEKPWEWRNKSLR